MLIGKMIAMVAGLVLITAPLWGAEIEASSKGGDPVLAVTPAPAGGEPTLDYGVLATGDSRELVVSVSNAGKGELKIADLLLPQVLTGPFWPGADLCSGSVLEGGEKCTITVRFAPLAAGTYHHTFILRSSASEATVQLQGEAAAPAPPGGNVGTAQSVIEITDSVPPFDDRLLDFGAVGIGGIVDLTVTVANQGSTELVLGDLNLGQDLQPPFTAAEDGCSRKTLPADRSTTCSVRLRFGPVAFGHFSDSFQIPSNDPLRSSVRVDLRGMSGPDLGVGDNVPPRNDLVLPFGNVPLGMAKRKIVSLENIGTADLQIGVIPPPASRDFSLVSAEENTSDCSEQRLAPGQSCFIIVSFSPSAEGDFGDTLIIPSDDLDHPQTAVQLSGTGAPETTDFPAPVLIHPDPGQLDLREDVTFRWYNARDSSGRLAVYRFYCSREVNFSGSRIREVGRTAVSWAGMGFAGGLLLIPRLRRRLRRTFCMLFLLTVATLILSCSEDIEDSSTATLNELERQTTFFWKVVAEYDDNLERESEIRQFKTR